MTLDLDYSNPSRLADQLKKHTDSYGKWDILIHNAGLTVSVFRDEYYEINERLTARLVEAVKESEVLDSSGKLIYVSSYAAYGPSGINQPVSAYGKSKAAAEKHIAEAGYDYMICRPTGIYGSGDMAFLPLFKTAAFGFFPMMSPTNQQLTLIHGADLASGIVQHLNNAEKYLHFNDGNSYTHADFKEALSKAVGKKLIYLRLPIAMVRMWLKLSDHFYRVIKGRPGVTLEKYDEISMNWDLHKTTDLYHPPINCQYNLTSGSKEAYDFYKKHKLV